jgi:hypothetical protein
MIRVSRGLLGLVAKQANLAPSVHNTQPTRWRLGEDGGIDLLLDARRLLPVGDPEGRDAAVSAGAALEATCIVLSGIGLRGNFEAAEHLDRGSADGRPLLLGRLRLSPGREPDPLLDAHVRRATWRGGFAKASPEAARSLGRLCEELGGVVMVPGAERSLAELGDAASLGLLRRTDYRDELRSWMRLSPRDPGWCRDGLNARSLALGRPDALGASTLLRPRFFAAADAVGLAGPLLSERRKTRSATAVLLVHRPGDEGHVESGRALHRLWLEVTRLGFLGWPMTSVADDPEIRSSVSRTWGIPDDRRLLTALRVGPGPAGLRVPRFRLPPSELVLDPAA